MSLLNWDKSAVSFRFQVAAWVLDMFDNFYFVKNHKIVKNSTTTDAREKISMDLEFLEFENFFWWMFDLIKKLKFYLLKLGADF